MQVGQLANVGKSLMGGGEKKPIKESPLPSVGRSGGRYEPVAASSMQMLTNAIAKRNQAASQRRFV